MTHSTREKLEILEKNIDTICSKFEGHVSEMSGLIESVQSSICSMISEQREEIVRLREELTRLSIEEQERRAKALEAMESE